MFDEQYAFENAGVGFNLVKKGDMSLYYDDAIRHG
jgi:hypothetical protein